MNRRSASIPPRPAARLNRFLRGIAAIACAILLGASCPNSATSQAIDTTMWVTNGNVNTMAKMGNTLYLGGFFSRVGPATGGGVIIDSSSGGVVLGFPRVLGTVRTAVPDLHGGWYLGGTFTRVGGLPRQNLAHLWPDNTVSAWNPGANAEVRAIAVQDTSVFIGGSFTTIAGVTRNRIASLHRTTGAARAFDAGAVNAAVHAIVFTPGESLVVVGGAFTQIGGGSRNRLAALNFNTGGATAWNPNANADVNALTRIGSVIYAGGNFTVFALDNNRSRLAAFLTSSPEPLGWNPGANAVVNALATNGTRIYAGGGFSSVGGLSRFRIAAIDSGSNIPTSWNPDMGSSPNDVRALAVSLNLVYVGGDFSTAGGQPRSYIAVIDAGTGLAAPWAPEANRNVYAVAVSSGRIFAGGSFTSVGGVARTSLAAIDLATGQPTAWNPVVGSNPTIHSMVRRGETLYIGGAFSTINGLTRSNLARIDAITGISPAWGVGANNTVYSVADGGRVIYAGGAFTSIAGASRNRLAAIDDVGNATSWNPGPNAQVNTIAADGMRVYVGGTFITIGGAPRQRIAAIDSTLGTATSWDPRANANVQALLVTDSLIYAGGDFTTMNGPGANNTRNRIAAIDRTTGLVTPWDPNANGQVRSLVPVGRSLYVCGAFTNVGGSGPRAAHISTNTGVASPWAPNPDLITNAVIVDGTAAYIGGAQLQTGNYPQSGIARVAAAPEILAATPSVGGNSGSTTMTLTGQGFAAGSTVRLLRGGQSDITGAVAAVTSDGLRITVAFDLSGKAPGSWDILVTLPDGQTATAADTFQVQLSSYTQARVDIVGPDLVRANHRNAFDIVIQNEGTTDLVTRPLWIGGIPVGSTLEFDFPIVYPTQEGGQPDWTQVPARFNAPAGDYTAFVIPRVPVGGIVTRRIYLTVPMSTTAFTLRTAMHGAWTSPEVKSCLIATGTSTTFPVLGSMTAILDSVAGHPEIDALSGIGVWAKSAFLDEGMASLGAAVTEAEQAMDLWAANLATVNPVSPCGLTLTPRWLDSLVVSVVTSIDPNDKLGPSGTLSREQAIPYSIRFENLSTATAPAQRVVVIDALDISKLNPMSVILEAIRFGSVTRVPPLGVSNYTTEVDLRPGTNLIVRISAVVNRFTGVLTWTFTSLDPSTGQPPLSPLAGFLPPNDASGAGEGSVLFAVRAASVGGGDFEISNEASINFDGVSHLTPRITNLVDNTPPSSAVQPLSSPAATSRFTVSWNAGGTPDLKDYTIMVSENGGGYTTWQEHTTATADAFAAVPGGHTYAFYSIARDHHGNIEAAPLTPDAQTMSPVAVEGASVWRLALEGAIPNPAVGSLRVWFTLPDAGKATLDVLDVAGRRVVRREVGSLGAGRHSLALGAAERMHPGLYFLRLIRGADVRGARVALMK